VAFVGAAVLTYFFGVTNEAPDETTTAKLADDTIMAPVEGTIIPLTSVKDEVFASEAMGKGLAIVPTNGEVKSPVTGTVSAVYPTGHAIGITADNGAEILIHIGIDTVQLNGKYFETLVKQNAHVNQGELVTKFDAEKIKAAGYDTTVMVIVTNTTSYAAVEPTDATEAQGNWLLKLQPKSTAKEGVTA